MSTMSTKPRLLLVIVCVGSVLGMGCGGAAVSSSTGAGGGAATGSGGFTSTGGSTSSGGATPAGGAPGSGGRLSPGTGGATSSGGNEGAGTGGNPSQTGGNIGSGGASNTGGTNNAGGTSAGTGGRADAGVGGSTSPGTGGAGGAKAVDGGVDSIATGDSGAPPTGNIKVWLAGDSTMQPCTTACPCGWGSQFQPLFNSNATVMNNGAGGRSIQTWLYDPNVTTTMSNGECVVSPKTYSTRWQAMLDGMKAGDYLFIEFGINDGDSTCNRHVGTALFQSYLSTMAQAAKARGAFPILLTSTSYIECSGTKVTANRGFGPQTKAAGTENDVPVIDLSVLSAALYTSLGLCPNSSDYTSTTSAVGKFFCDDHTHFESAGAAQIAAVVAKALRDQKIPLAAYLK